MNAEWKRLSSSGEHGKGFLDVYSVKYESSKFLVTINYLPQLCLRKNIRDVAVSVFFEGASSNLTDGLFHWIHDDIGDLIIENEAEKFNIESDPVRIFFSQVYSVNQLPALHLIAHADYAFRTV